MFSYALVPIYSFLNVSTLLNSPLWLHFISSQNPEYIFLCIFFAIDQLSTSFSPFLFFVSENFPTRLHCNGYSFSPQKLHSFFSYANDQLFFPSIEISSFCFCTGFEMSSFLTSLLWLLFISSQKRQYYVLLNQSTAQPFFSFPFLGFRVFSCICFFFSTLVFRLLLYLFRMSSCTSFPLKILEHFSAITFFPFYKKNQSSVMSSLRSVFLYVLTFSTSLSAI